MRSTCLLSPSRAVSRRGEESCGDESGARALSGSVSRSLALALASCLATTVLPESKRDALLGSRSASTRCGARGLSAERSLSLPLLLQRSVELSYRQGVFCSPARRRVCVSTRRIQAPQLDRSSSREVKALLVLSCSRDEQARPGERRDLAMAAKEHSYLSDAHAKMTLPLSTGFAREEEEKMRPKEKRLYNTCARARTAPDPPHVRLDSTGRCTTERQLA